MATDAKVVTTAMRAMKVFMVRVAIERVKNGR